MTEWEKLISGRIYNDFDDDLFQRRIQAKELFRAYNKTEDTDTSLRTQLLTKLFKSMGEDVWIEPDFRCEYGRNITVGNHVYINFGCIILDCADILIGGHVLFGPNVGLYAANHAIDAEERRKGGCIGAPIQIKDGVWLGGDVKILGGVTVGENAIVGTGSIVTKDIPTGVIAAGNPCRVIRKITEQDKTDYLQSSGL